MFITKPGQPTAKIDPADYPYWAGQGWSQTDPSQGAAPDPSQSVGGPGGGTVDQTARDAAASNASAIAALPSTYVPKLAKADAASAGTAAASTTKPNLLDISGGNATRNLPAANSVPAGTEAYFKVTVATDPTNPTTVATIAPGTPTTGPTANTADTINGAAGSLTMRVKNRAKRLVSDGVSNWNVLGGDTDATIEQQIGDSRYPLRSRLAINVKNYGALGDGVTDDTTAVQAALTAAASAAETAAAEVYIPAGVYIVGNLTLPHGVSIRGAGRQATVLRLKANTGGSVLLSAGFASNVNGAGSTAWGAAPDWTVPSYFTLSDFMIDGNAANQPTPAAVGDYRQNAALVKLWGYHMTLRNLELNNAREIALYTEHYGSWENTFNQFRFGESSFENIFAKNYWLAGWINRGPHDSTLTNVYLSSYQASGGNAYVGYVQQTNNPNYSSAGLIANNLHVWGEHQTNAIYIDNSSILDGLVYAEGCQQAAIKLVNGSACNFKAFVGFCQHGIEQFSGSGNKVEVTVESTVSGSAVKMTAGGKNEYTITRAYNDATTSGVDFTAYTDPAAGNGNLFRLPIGLATPYTGTPGRTDQVIIGTKPLAPAAIIKSALGLYRGDSFGGTYATNQTGNNATGYFTPITVQETETLNSIAVQLNTIGSAGALLRAGIYADDGSGRPTGSPIVDAGTKDAATAAGPITWTISQQLKPGIYHVVLKPEGAPTTAPKWMGYTSSMPNAPTNVATPSAGWVFVFTGGDGALTAVTPASLGYGGFRPAMTVRVASRP